MINDKAKAARVLHLHGMNNQSIAEVLDLDPSTVSRYIANERQYDAEFAIAKALHGDDVKADLDELLVKHPVNAPPKAPEVPVELLDAKLGDALAKGFKV